MSDEDFDPEIAADIALRESSRHDSSRTRGRGKYDWSPPPIVTHWPCRSREGCRSATAGQPAEVGITAEALDALDTANRELRSRGEADIPIHSIVFCDACKRYGLSLQAKANRDRTDVMAERVRKLRDGCSQDEEREIIERLRKSHPDVDGLMRTLREKREQGKKPRKGI